LNRQCVAFAIFGTSDFFRERRDETQVSGFSQEEELNFSELSPEDKWAFSTIGKVLHTSFGSAQETGQGRKLFQKFHMEVRNFFKCGSIIAANGVRGVKIFRIND
jgi:hypothetical protein